MEKHITTGANDGAEGTVCVVGIDLAKNVFAVHGINAAGNPVLVRPRIRRDQLSGRGQERPGCSVPESVGTPAPDPMLTRMS